MNCTSTNKIHPLEIFVLTKEENFMLDTVDKIDDPDNKRKATICRAF